MADENNEKKPSRPSKRRDWHRQVTGKKLGLIFIGIVVAIAGFGMMAADGNISESPSAVSEQDAHAKALASMPENARGFVSERQIEIAKTELAEASRSIWDRLGPWFIGAGISFAVGIVLGIMFRTFIKTAASLVALVIAGVLVSSYFGADFSGFREHLTQAVDMAKDEAGAARGWIIAALPNGVVAFVGFIFGFMRK